MTPEELEERIEEIAEDVDKRLGKIEAILGDWTRQVTPENLASLKVEIPGSGQYPVDVALKVATLIEADQRELIDGLAEEIRVLKLAVEGSVSEPPPAPQPTPLPENIQELALRLQPFFNDGTLSVGNVPGFGVGVMARTSTGKNAFIIFTTDYDGAFRILPGVDPDRPETDFCSNPDAYYPRFEYEQNGVWYIGVGKPFNVSAGEHDYPNKKGKQIAIDGGDFDGNRRAGKTAKIYGSLVGRHFALGVARTKPNVLDPVSSSHRGTVYGDVIIDGDDGVNPISITVGGQNRKLVVKNVNGTEVLAPE